MSEDARTFTCHGCGGVFEFAWTDEEAEAESRALFGPLATEELAVICDDCFDRTVLRSGSETGRLVRSPAVSSDETITKRQADKLLAVLAELRDVKDVMDALFELGTEGECLDREGGIEDARTTLSDWLESVAKVAEVARAIGLLEATPCGS
jgi:hypothetical protein